MSTLPDNVKRPHFRAHREARPKRLLVPAKDGTLEVKEMAPDIKHLRPAVAGAGRRKPARQKNKLVKRAGQDLGAAGLKVLDIVAFNTKAEEFFVFWLSEAIAAAGEAGRPVAWILANAAFELDVSTETVKRYLAKHTAERAEFIIEAGQAFIRE